MIARISRTKRYRPCIAVCAHLTFLFSLRCPTLQRECQGDQIELSIVVRYLHCTDSESLVASDTQHGHPGEARLGNNSRASASCYPLAPAEPGGPRLDSNKGHAALLKIADSPTLM